jgi:hypothetical protein
LHFDFLDGLFKFLILSLSGFDLPTKIVLNLGKKRVAFVELFFAIGKHIPELFEGYF